MSTTFLLGVTYCAALPITLTTRHNANNKMCRRTGKPFFSEIYHSSIQSVTIECLLPILSMSVLYRKMSRKLLSQSVDAQQLSRENYDHFQQRKKAVKTIKWLIVLFTLIVLPGRIVHAVRSGLYNANKKPIKQEYVALVLELFDKYTYVNNLINVFVYCKINKYFRQYLKEKCIRQ